MSNRFYLACFRDNVGSSVGWQGYHYSAITRTLKVFGAKMTHQFSNVSVGEIEELVTDAKFKEATWRA